MNFAHIQVVKPSFAFKGSKAHFARVAGWFGQKFGGPAMSHLFPTALKAVAFAFSALIVLLAAVPILTVGLNIVA